MREGVCRADSLPDLAGSRTKLQTLPISVRGL